MSTPAVSVVIPTYNHRAYVLETLESVFAQTFTDYEVIVVNDGSPDDTAEVLRPLAESGRIKYIEQLNAGQAAARNRGIAEARGEFIALLDDDDLWPPDKLAWQFKFLSTHRETVLVAGYVETFGDIFDRYPRDESLVDPDLFNFRTGNWILSPGQTLIRASAVKAVGDLDTRIWGADDWDLYIRLSGAGRLQYSQELSLRYRLHTANSSRNAVRMYENSLAVFRKNLRLFTGPDADRIRRKCSEYVRDYGVNVFLQSAARATVEGDLAKTRADYMRAAKLRPILLARPKVLWGLTRTILPRGIREVIANRRRVCPGTHVE